MYEFNNNMIRNKINFQFVLCIKILSFEYKEKKHNCDQEMQIWNVEKIPNKILKQMMILTKQKLIL